MDKQRRRIGNRAAMAGLAANLLLASLKFLLARQSGSVAVRADALNNASDALSSLLVLVSFLVSSKPADREHPYGHYRMEWVMSLLVGLSILWMGARLAMDAVASLARPQPLHVSRAVAAGLMMSMAVKAGLSFFYRHLHKTVPSPMLKAQAEDAASDVLATLAVLAGLLAYRFFAWRVDGVLGLAVAVLIFKNGYQVLRENVTSILGGNANKALVSDIEDRLLACDDVLGVHDFMLHDYGAHQKFAVCDVQVDAAMTLPEAHRLVDDLERQVEQRFAVRLTLHVDPVLVKNKRYQKASEDVRRALLRVHRDLGYHDLHLEAGEGERIRLFFDVQVPETVTIPQDVILRRVLDGLRHRNALYQPTVRIDKIFS